METVQRRRPVTFAATAVAVFVLAVSVMLAAPPTAEADTGLLGPLTVGETFLAPEEVEAGAVVSSAACATGVGCLAIGGILLAGALYATRDHWLPVVQGALGQAYNFAESLGASGCSVTGAGSLSGAAVSVSLSWLNCGGYGGWYVTTSSYTCVAGDSYTTNGTTKQTPIANPGSTKGTETATVTLCGTGQTLTNVRFHVGVSTSYNGGWSPWYDLSLGTDPAKVTETSTVTCSLPDGTTQTITESQTGADEVVVPSCSAKYPGSVPSDFTATAGPPGAQSTILHQPLTSPTTVRTNYANCFDGSGALNGSCVVRPWIDGQPCAQGMAGCNDPETYAQDHPGTSYDCRWGGYVVAWDNCAGLRNHYGGQTQVVSGVDPKTGKPNLDPTVGPSVGSSTGTDTPPTTGTNPAGPPVPVDTATDPDTQNCWGQGWSWNPVSWVYVPTKCALKWAFVPDTAPSFSDVPSPLPPGWLPSFPSLSSSVCGPVSMPQLQLGFKGWHVGPVTLFDTCADPWPLVRTFTYNGTLALLLCTVIWQGFRAVTSGLGMGVGIGNGGDDE